MKSKKYFLYLTLLSAVILSSCSTLPVQNPVQTSEETSVSSEANIITTATETVNTSSLPVFTDVKEILDFPQDLNEQDLIEYFKKAEALYASSQGIASIKFYKTDSILCTDPLAKDHYLLTKLGIDSITLEQFFELYYDVFTENFLNDFLFKTSNERHYSIWENYNNNVCIDSGELTMTKNISNYYNYDAITFFHINMGYGDMSLVTKNTYVKSITDNEIIYTTSIFQVTPDLGYTDVHFEKGVLIDNKTGSTYTPDQSKGEHITSHDYSLKLQSDGSWKFDDFVFLY